VAETARTRAFIWGLLANDATLNPLIGAGSAARIFNGVAPAGTSYPYVVMQLLSGGNDLMAVGAIRVWADMLWLIKVITRGTSTGGIEPIVNRIDALLHAKSGTVTNGVIHECVRERPFELPTVEDGVAFVQLGAEWRIKASNA
jgi:hypothetical protein